MDQISPEIEKVIEQVQKLLNLSKSGNEHEAALAFAKAEALLEKYRLDMTTIEMMTGKKEEIVQEDEPLMDTESISEWESKLGNGIAHLHGCTTIRIGQSMLKIIGRKSDIMFVRYFVTYIVLEIFRISGNALYKKRKNYKDAWFRGVVDTVLNRLYAAQRETRKNFNNPHAVVTIDNRYNESMEKLKELYPNFELVNYKKRTEKEIRYDEKAYNEGRVAGSRIKLKQDQSLINNTKGTLQS